ncbi:MAG: energy transducer TonB [Pseudomonadota bacterium]
MNRVAQSYPARALAAGLEGSVAVSLTVSSGGRVSACRVTQSSGETVLDEAACTAFARYARFRPALDPQGQPTRGLYSTSVRYSLS